MKGILKKILEYKLRVLAKKILRKYHPDIIGITGSVGKTSTKEAMYSVLKDFFDVRKSEKNYNNEIGVPLAIIGQESGKKSVMGWMKVFWHAKKFIWFRMPYPKILILEMAADKAGDIEYLVSFIKCKIGVLTAFGHAHLEQFKTQQSVIKEKRKLIESLDRGGFALLNADDENIMAQKKYTKARILAYGFSPNADLRASEVKIIVDPKNGFGSVFKLLNNKSVIPVFLKDCVGEQFVLSALAAVCVAEIYGLTLIQAANALKNFHPPSGRMRFLKGIKNSKIIDDTYNSSPESVLAALKALSFLTAERKIAVLGDMLELGAQGAQLHFDIGKSLQDFGVDILMACGERARDIARGARESGMLPDRIFEFSNAQDSGKFLQNRLLSGDLVLVKGSQGMRMEKTVLEIMAEPLRAQELLVRQGKEWM